MNRKRDGELYSTRWSIAAAIAAMAMTVRGKRRREYLDCLQRLAEAPDPSGNVVSLRSFLRTNGASDILPECAATMQLATEMVAELERRRAS